MLVNFSRGEPSRAAAFSAARAGLRPRCLDQYADADLAALRPSTRFDPRKDERRVDWMAMAHGCASCHTIPGIEGADAYAQEGQLTTFFRTTSARQVVDCWSVRLASFRTSRVSRCASGRFTDSGT